MQINRNFFNRDSKSTDKFSSNTVAGKNNSSGMEPADIGIIQDKQSEQDIKSDASVDIKNKPTKNKLMNKIKKYSRFLTDFVLQLGFSDLSSVLSMLSHITPLPPGISAAVKIADSANIATNTISGGLDAWHMKEVLTNPDATKLDKAVDIGHFAVSDVIATAGALMPFFLSLSNPVTMAIFLGLQIAGIAADIGKAAYDIHRKGEQSIRKE